MSEIDRDERDAPKKAGPTHNKHDLEYRTSNLNSEVQIPFRRGLEDGEESDVVQPG